MSGVRPKLCGDTFRPSARIVTVASERPKLRPIRSNPVMPVFWHAVALAWDPAAKDAPADSDRDGRVVSASTPVGATIVIDPDGRLTWSWSQRGTLIAGGTLLLRKAQARIGAEPEVDAAQPGLRLGGQRVIEAYGDRP